MTCKVLVFDSATRDLFLWSIGGGGEKCLRERYDRGSFLSAFPPLLERFMADIVLDDRTGIYISIGPGSFTGIKTGVSLIGGLLYARGAMKVRLISSLDLRAARVAFEPGSTCLIAMPFHGERFFLSAFRWDGMNRQEVLPPRLVLPREVPALLSPLMTERTLLIADPGLASETCDIIRSTFPSLGSCEPGDTVRADILAAMPVVATVALCRDPLMLNYIEVPASLQGGDGAAYYVSHASEQEV